MPPRWPPLLLLLLLGVTAALAEPSEPAARVLHVPPLSEEVRTDGTDDLGFSGPGRLADSHVKRMWGVSDVTARAGRLFVHTIDKDAFRGAVASYQVGGASGGDPLPGWLTFEPARRTFSGVPLAAELGPHLVTVRAVGADGHSSAKDRFMVDVVRERDAAGLAGRPPGRDEETGELSCADRSAATVLSLYFDVAPQSLDGAQRLGLLRSVAESLQVDPEAIHMSFRRDSLPLDDDSVLEAGAGARARRSHHLTVLSWKVGCSTLTRPAQQAALQTVRSDPGLARLSTATGQPAAAWLLTARQSTGRHRRQAAQVEGSGSLPDDDYSDDEYDYSEDGYGDYSDDYSDYGDEPVSRVVPSLSTPSLGAPLASPVYPPPRVSGSLAVSRMSTPVPVPVQPTRYVDLLQPSRGGDEAPAGPPRDTTHLESSMAVPGGRVEATARLPAGAAVAPTATFREPAETAAVDVPDYPPHLKKHIRKQLLVAGKEFRIRVPEETFEDLESGMTRQLTLTLRKGDGQPLTGDDWLQFDADTQEIYGLPLEEHVGEYQYELTARDQAGGTATERLSVAVRLYQQWRAINHRFYLTFKLLSPSDFNSSVDWELLVLRKLANMFDQSSTSSLLVYELRRFDGSVRLGWVNDTVSTHRCDKLALARIASHLLGKDGAATPQLRKVLSPEFRAQKVRLELLNVCRGAQLASLPPPATEAPRQNSAPQRLGNFDLITATVGKLLKLQVPANTFFDEEDQDAREMTLRLLTSERQPVPSGSWLQFEPKNQEFIGLPLDNDVGTTHYHLECIDSGGLKAFNSIEVKVASRHNATDYTVEFGVTLDNDFASFGRDPLQKQRLMQKLAELLGDSGPDAMLVHAIRPGSVLFSWFNDTLARERCPDAEIAVLRGALLDDTERVQPAAVQALGPEFRLSAARVTPRGICLAETTPTTGATPTLGAAGPLDEQAPQSKGDEYLVTFIIPAVVIAAMLVIAGLIACVLYRARRRGKMTMTDNGTYVSRGIPVIFSDELEDRMEKNAKTPVILTNERPPEPPTYPADGAASPATPMLDARGEPAGSGAEDVPYERPPPLSGGESGRAAGRAKPVPNYRQPPPYVPP